MIESTETAAVVALLRHGDRLWHHYADLIESAGSALSVLSGDFDDPAHAHAPPLFDPSAWSHDVDLDAVAAEIDTWRSEGIDVLTVLDERYPSNLRLIHNRPPLIFVRGRLTPDDDRSIAVVGTRQATQLGLEATADMAATIAQAGYTVVSRLAEGIDTAAHEAALGVGGRTVAVIGTGLRRSYPSKNASLQKRLATEAAVVSQFWPDQPPTRTTFPMRNVVMSGLALATVVIEASGTSGAKMQARFALEHGRPVFLMSSLLEHRWARDYAERPGTHVVDSASEVLERVERLTTATALTL
ncbi:MAG: DNA-protecting protein DprA [Chloroflexota bacterium]|nr:DNA-protecting protein DprA [Chloroflexota bacterium]